MRPNGLSAQQRRSWLRDPETLRMSECVISLPYAIGVDEVRRALTAPAVREGAARRFARQPDRTVPVRLTEEPQVPTVTAEGDGRGRVAVEGAGSPVRTRVPVGEWGITVRISGGGHRLVVSAPTLTFDATSLLLWVRDLTAALADPDGDDVTGSADAPGYQHYTRWQDAVLSDMDPEELAYWQAKRDDLTRCASPLNTTARPEPGGAWETLPVETAGPDLDDLLRTAEKLAAEPEDLLLACWGFLVAQNAGVTGICLGVTFPGRDTESFHTLRGPLARTLPMGFTSTPSLPDAIRAVGESRADLAEWQECFDWGLKTDDPVAFPVGFRALTVPTGPSSDLPGGAHVEGLVDADNAATLFCSVLRFGTELRLQLDFDPGVHDPAAVQSLARQFQVLLRHAAQEPEAPLPERLLHEDDFRRAGSVFAGPTRARRPDSGAAELFRGHVLRAPAHPALVDGARTVTYAQLDAWAGRIAGRLAGHDADYVGLLLGPGAPLIAAMLGCLYSGKTMVLMDPGHPDRVLHHIRDDSGMGVLITEPPYAERVGDWGVAAFSADEERFRDGQERTGEGAAAVPVPAGRTGPAYVIYTSGTTGRPKGVVVPQRALVNYALWLGEDLGFDDRDRPALLTSAAFDLGHTALWGALLHGGTLVLPSQDTLGDPHRLLDELVREHVTALKLTPSLLRLLLDTDTGQLARLAPRLLVVGGEAVRPSDLERLHKVSPATVIVNHYGPTETTVGCVAERVQPSGLGDFLRRPVLGTPIANTTVHILDEKLRPVAPGVIGEICVAGDGLSDGYLGDDDLTAARFVDTPRTGRVHRTGDLGLRFPDGRIAFSGRADSRHKVRGHRVELDGVAQILREHPGVDDATVVVDTDPAGQNRLLAYCAPSTDRTGPVARLCALLDSAPEVAGGWTELPDGRPVLSLNPAETSFAHQELFVERAYLREGIRVTPGSVVIDVGANVGMFSLQVATEAPGSRIIAIEPAPAAFARLRANSALYGDAWTPVAAALSAAAGRATLTSYADHSMLATLHPAEDEDRNLLKSLAEQRLGRGLDPAESGHLDELLDEQLAPTAVECELTTLSQVIRDHGLARVDLLKIDAQRAEWDILLGIDDGHWPLIRQIVLEAQGDASHLGRIREALVDRGFRVKTEGQDHTGAVGHALMYATRPGAKPQDEGPATYAPKSWSSPRRFVADLRDHLATELPDHAIPARIVLVPGIPLTRNRKADHAALRATAHALDIERRPTEPTTALGQRLAALWRSVLGVDEIGMESHFIERGGDSLRSARLATRIRDELGTHVTMTEILRTPRFEDLLNLLTSKSTAADLIASSPWGDTHPLSHLQERIWLLSRLEGGNEAFNLSRAFRLTGEIRPELLEQALAAVVERHEALRTVLRQSELGQQVRASDQCHPPLTVETADSPWSPAAAAERAMAEARCPFDLARDVLLRGAVTTFADGEHLLTLTTHHIVADGWSVEVLVADFFEAYGRLRAGDAPFPGPLPRRHRDYLQALDDLARKAREEAADHLARWADPSVSVKPLPTDAPRPPVPSFQARNLHLECAPDVYEGLRDLARTQGVTPFVVCVAAIHAVLAQWTGERRQVLAASHAGRDLPGIGDQVGLFANTVLLRGDVVPGAPFAQLVRTTGAEVDEVLRHQYLALSDVVARIGAQRHGGLSSAPSVGITWHSIDRAAEVAGVAERCGFSCEPIEMDEHASRADLWFFVLPGDTLRWQIIYDAALFHEETVAAVAEDLSELLRQAARDPGLRVGPAGPDFEVHL
ncbi:amino acid adenylation domain-containing protein [Streptomyces sp. NPDC048441]|uniref:amino acid adenylation domain-containing protein n=1 Tax=Streptomyces sp. NPDC048441 TaxID=3365552 RepID=UPI0037162D0F